MKKILILLSISLISATALAGMTNFWCEFPDDPGQTSHNWDFDYGIMELTLGETIYAVGPDQVVMSADFDGDPTFTVVKTVENDSGVTWDGYTLTLEPGGSGANFVIGTAGSTKFGVASETASEIVFAAPQPVLDGEIVTLQFDINIPVTSGSWAWTLTQNPVPEPATLALLSLGGLVLARKR